MTGERVPDNDHVAGWVDFHSSKNPESPAVLSPSGQALTYAQLSAALCRTAAFYGSNGLGPRSMVAVIVPGGWTQAISVLATLSGAVCLPLNPQTTAAELAPLVAELGIEAIVATAPILERFAGDDAFTGLLRIDVDRDLVPLWLAEEKGSVEPLAPEAVELSRLCLLLGTSGTTSRPKYIRYTVAQLTAFARDMSERLGLRSDDRCLSMMPFYHSHGLLVAFLAGVAAGGSIVCQDGMFIPGKFLRDLGDWEATWYTAVPTIQRLIVETKGPDVPAQRLRFIRSASSALGDALRDDLARKFQVPVIETYGLSEVLGWLSMAGPGDETLRPGSVGRACSLEMVILGEGDQELPPGETGEIAVPRDRFLRYWGQDDQPDGRWFRTGDLGYLDADRFLFLTGREKEMINRGGEKVAPQEVEDVILAQPEVLEAVVFPVAHPVLQEEVAAAVVYRDGSHLSQEELSARLRPLLSAHKLPKNITILDELPRSAIGKYQRRKIAALLAPP